MFLLRSSLKNCLTFFVLLSSPLSLAATLDLTSAGGNGGGWGNSLQFTDGDLNLEVSAFGETGAESPPGSLFYLFEQAEVYSWSTGIGACNQQEGMVGTGCNNNEHEIDTVNRDDLVVFKFNQTVNFEFLTVDPYNGPGNDPNDRDIIYWVGESALLPDLTSETFDTLDSLAGFGSETLSTASSSFHPYTHALSGTGNILMLSGNYHDLACKNKGNRERSCEAFKLRDITVSAVPVPMAFWLLTSALVALLGYRRSLQR